ncbi:TD and POZ domain-containing protein 2 [Araneus ventricosus]|uniref:TD and POZ domain-containing protein 2 n=1 Tax=Araneus ventricosus TaxID=182803 RepID=A0A4Y2NYH5_ARAVE|nr:TD and POZ domain-containing protein 2 [Araneus ventricosus]
MSLGNNEIAGVCRFHTEAITRISAKLHRVRWTVENVSQIIDKERSFKEIKGPDFYFTSTRMHFGLIKMENNLTIRLYNKSDKCIDIEINLVILDSDGSKLHELKKVLKTIQTNQYAVIMDKSFENQGEQLNSLKDDKLIIDCFLKKEGRVITKSNSFQNETRSQKKLLNDLKMIYNNPEDYDFTFQVEDDFIHAHKTILSFRSEYFKRMFKTQMKEEVQNSVLIVDFSYSTMKKLVEFLYTGDFTKTEEDDDGQDIWNLYVAADKYQVMDLRSLCGSKLISTATVDNIIDILQLSARHNDEDLKTEALESISFDFAAIVKSNVWKTFQSREADLASEVVSFCLKKLG